MRLKEIHIQNYKSWSDSSTIKLHDGLTIVVGQNNVGKTAFLESLSLKAAVSPTRQSLPNLNLIHSWIMKPKSL